MQLELNAVMLKDIWPHLYARKCHENDVNAIGHDKSIWEALDMLSAKKQNHLVSKKFMLPVR